MKRYILDLTKVENLPEHYLDCRLIPCVEGRHWHEYDVIENEIPPDVLKSLRKEASKRCRPAPWWPEDMKSKFMQEVKSYPIGFNMTNCQFEGAVLRKA